MAYKSFSAEKKLEVLKSYAESNLSVREVCEEYGISSTTFKKWRQLYSKHGDQGLQPSTGWKDYSEELKLSAVRDYQSGSYSFSSIIRKYDISSRTVFKMWLKKYNGHGEVTEEREGWEYSMTKGRKTTWKERIEIVHHCLATGKDFSGTAAEYGVSYNQVYQWVRKYEAGSEEALKDRRGRDKTEDELTSEERVKLEMKRLRKENEQLRAQNALLKKLEEIERRRS